MIFGKYVNVFYKKYAYLIFIGLACLILVDVIQILMPNLIGNVVNFFAEHKDINIAFDIFYSAPITSSNSFAFLLTGLLLIAFGMLIGRMGWRYALFKLGASVDFDLRQNMFSHGLNLSVSYYKNRKIGALMSLYNNDLFAIRNCFIDGIIMTIDGFIMAPLVVVSMFLNNWLLALISLVPLIILMVICFVLDKGMTLRYEGQLNAFERLSDYTQESFGGISIVKAFVKEAKFMMDFAKKNKDNKQANIAYLKYSVVLNALIEFLINSIFVIIIFIGVTSVNLNSEYKVGDLIKFIGYLSAAIWPFMAIAQVIMIRSRGKASLKIITEYLDTTSELKDNKQAKEISFKGEVDFKNFNFHYPDSTDLVLKDINIHISAGEKIGIVGRTGSGKSTLVKVLLKIYNIDDGKLFFDKIDINDLSSKNIRDNIGYVAQNAYLFSDLIRNNIAFYNDDVDDEKIIQAAKFACIDGSIKAFKDGYKTLIGEKGASLSGGQKQRIAISRAVIKDPSILILDDSVSAVDSDTEKDILGNISKIRENKTTFIVSSRVSVVENLDAIIVMDKGRIIGFGKHEDLINNCREYAELVKLQQLASGGE